MFSANFAFVLCFMGVMKRGDDADGAHSRDGPAAAFDSTTQSSVQTKTQRRFTLGRCHHNFSWNIAVNREPEAISIVCTTKISTLHWVVVSYNCESVISQECHPRRVLIYIQWQLQYWHKIRVTVSLKIGVYHINYCEII